MVPFIVTPPSWVARSEALGVPSARSRLLVVVLHLAHLRHQVGPLDQLRRGAPAGEDHLDLRGPLVQHRQHILDTEQPKPDGHVDLIQHHDVILPGEHGLASTLQPTSSLGDVLRRHLLTANTAYVAVLLDGDQGVVAQGFELSVVLALHELANVGPHSVARGPQRQTQSGRRLALAVPGVHLNVAPQKLTAHLGLPFLLTNPWSMLL